MSPLCKPFLLVSALCLLVTTGVCEDDLKFEQSPKPSVRGHFVHVAPIAGCPDDYCHIGERCIPAGHRADPPDTCWMCLPSQSVVAWSYSKDEKCMHGGLDTWHMVLIIVGSILIVVMMISLAGYRMRRHLLKRQRVYPNYTIDVPHDGPLLKQMQ